ncbi:hypothetical protein LCGC14_1842880 [marine sediment metagenome]|uniref:Uncharacterized protein n=1 Tax=marine sediment metagenome TaxID=412755 RepID=A0A0F9GCT0_9ZZZZ
MKRLIKEYGHWKIQSPLWEFIDSCRSDVPTRFSIEHVYVPENRLVATDGRRLIVVNIEHKIKEGLYPVTKDGYLLKADVDGEFPKYQDIVPDKKNMTHIVESEDRLEIASFLVLGALVNAGCIVDLKKFLPPMKALEKIKAGCINVWVDAAEPELRPFMLECQTSLDLVTYIQMPVRVKNKIKGVPNGKEENTKED